MDDEMELWDWKEKSELEKIMLDMSDFQIRFLHPKICNYERVGNG